MDDPTRAFADINGLRLYYEIHGSGRPVVLLHGGLQTIDLMFGPLLASKEPHLALNAAARRAFGFVLEAAIAHDKRRGADLAIAGWSLAHGLSHLLIDGALEGLPIKNENPDALVRKISEHVFGSI